MMVSTEVQKVIINFGYFLKRICHQDFLNNRPSGHTGCCCEPEAEIWA